MKIKVLDAKSFGTDMIYDELYQLGEVEIYDATLPEDVEDRISDADVIVLNKVKIDANIIRSSKKLKLVCVFATGFDNIDLSAARECRVAVTNVPAYSTSSVVLYTITTALALISHLKEYNRYVVDGSYTKSGVPNLLEPQFNEIEGKTWGIIGAGNIGSSVARVASSLGANVIVNKRTHSPEFECVGIEELCQRSDIITIHCPLNEGTRNLINREMIDKMKPGVIIVNEARGAVVNESDVRDAVLEGKIAGFGCDVYSQEPFQLTHPYNDIMHLDNVILTPHCAWGSVEARRRCMSIVCKNIAAFKAGERLNRVD